MRFRLKAGGPEPCSASQRDQLLASTLIGARTVQQLQSNLGALDITSAPQQLDRLAAVSAPTLDFPARYAGYTGMAQFVGATVDGQDHDVNPPLLTSTTRY